MGKYRFFTNCILSTAEKIREMTDTAQEITFATFCKHVDMEDLRNVVNGYAWGSEKGLHLKDDFMVSYWKSVYDGRPCYYMDHSRIEYIFVGDK